MIIRDREKQGGWWGGGGVYTYCYSVTTRMIPALRRAAMRAILESDGQSHKTVPTKHKLVSNLVFYAQSTIAVTSGRTTNHNLFEEKGESKRYRTEVLLLTSITPYR